MKISPLTSLESASMGYTHKIALTFTDVKAMTSGAASHLLAVPVGAQVQRACARIVTPFATAGNTITLVAVVGDTGVTNRYIASQSLKGAAGLVLDGTTANMPFSYTAASNVDIIPTAGTEAITLLTAGEVHIYLFIADMALLDRS